MDEKKEYFGVRLPKELVREIKAYYSEQKEIHGASYTYAQVFEEFMGWTKDVNKITMVAESAKLSRLIKAFEEGEV
jgi:hypothetical protein